MQSHKISKKAILDFSRSVNISKTVRDRAISSEFLILGRIQECPIQSRKI